MSATSLMLTGLLLTYPSDYQMLRGAVVFFTGFFSRVFLKRKMPCSKWLGIAHDPATGMLFAPPNNYGAVLIVDPVRLAVNHTSLEYAILVDGVTWLRSSALRVHVDGAWHV